MFYKSFALWSVGIFLLWSFQVAAAVGQSELDLELAIEAVDRLDSSLWGLQFDERMKGGKSEAAGKLSHIEVSEDGDFRKCVVRVRFDSAGEPGDFLGGTYASGPGRFFFIASRRKYDSPDIPPTFGCAVTFFKENQLPFVASGLGGLPCGFTQDGLRRISDELRNGESEVREQRYKGQTYQALHCDIEGRPDITLLFDEAMRLKHIISHAEAGDRVGGHKFEEPQVMPPGEFTTIVCSLTSFVPVGEQNEVLAEYELSVEASSGVQSTVAYERQNFEALSEPLTSRISLPELEIEDGTLVSCNGQMGIDYIYDGGRLYMAADAVAVEAARKARLRQSRYGGVWYYSLGLLAFLVVLTVLVYIRNRDS